MTELEIMLLFSCLYLYRYITNIDTIRKFRVCACKTTNELEKLDTTVQMKISASIRTSQVMEERRLFTIEIRLCLSFQRRVNPCAMVEVAAAPPNTSE